MILSLRRRVVLSLLLVAEAMYLAFAIAVVLVPWEVTFSEFDGRPIGTLEAYVHTAPYLAMAVAAAGAFASLWSRGGRGGRRCVIATSVLHAAGAVWFLAQLTESANADVLLGAVILGGYAAVLLVLAWPAATARNVVRSAAS